jgi:hypothetical protein
MTEYEIASLALQQASGIREQVALTQTQLEVLASAAELQVQISVGYLVAAYLIGKSLTRVQAFVLNAFYIWVVMWRNPKHFGRTQCGAISVPRATHDRSRPSHAILLAGRDCLLYRRKLGACCPSFTVVYVGGAKE